MENASTTQDRHLGRARGPAPVPILRLVYCAGEPLVPPPVIAPERGETPIGREAKGGICLDGDAYASRLHATLRREAIGLLYVVDARSHNGTFVNGRRVEEAVLQDGDVLNIGDSYLVVRYEPAALEDAAVPGLLGTSPEARALRCAVHKLGPSDATVLLLGESGCGKEVVARALHALGRPGGPFVAVNASAIPETLAESQLFGHLAGSFTGAVARPGLFRAAGGGTLFLDEIGELPPAIQPKLLRVLEDRQVLPVGATTPVSVDVRIIAATNRDLRTAVAEQRFRGDLYARLAGIQVSLPPLRARREDVLEILLHALGDPPPSRRPRLSPALVEALLLYSYPFNVRELLAVAEQLRLEGAGAEELDLELVASRLRTIPPPPARGAEAAAPAGEVLDRSSEERDDHDPPPDRRKLEALLREHRGVVADVARSVRRSRKQVYRWLRHHDIDPRSFRA